MVETSPMRGDAQQAWLSLDIDEAARALEREPIIEPDLPIVDAHHHLWDGPVHRFDGYEFLKEAGSGHRIVASIFAECSSMYRSTGPDVFRSIGETEYVNGIAAMAASGAYGECRIAAGIVGFTDLCDPAAALSLDLHLARAGARFKGVRFPVAWHPDAKFRHRRRNPEPNLMQRREFRHGFDALAERGLNFDAWIYSNQAAELAELAAAYPQTQIVVNHFAGPVGIGEGFSPEGAAFAEWCRAIEALAKQANISCKLGGFGMPLFGFHGSFAGGPVTSMRLAELWAPMVHAAIAAFGPARCMFESNFPMDKELCGYATLWNAFKRIAQDYPGEARRVLFAKTAARIYRLDIAALA